MIDQNLVDELCGIVGAEHVHREAPLSCYTTFQIGGPAEVLVEPSSEHEVARVLSVCRASGVPYRLMGLGSDLLVADSGLSGVIVRLAERFSKVSVGGDTVFAQAGASNKEVAEAAQAAALAGYEFASGIPGTVGGAAIMNAGAYDGEFADVCTSVRCVTSEGSVVDVPRGDAGWGYRKSMMNECGYVVVGCTLQLSKDDPDAIRARMDDLAQRRASKQPLDMPSAGSTFKRPEGYFVGKLVQDAGLRGFQIGGAQVSTKHTGFVVNAGGATAADVRALIQAVQDRIFQDNGVHLEPEVRMWGFAGDPQARV